MAKFKNIKIKKRGGGSRLQRVKVLASGKYKFVKNLRKGSKKKTSSKTSKGRKPGMTKKKRRRASRKIPLAPILGIVGSLGTTAPMGRSIIDDLMKGDMAALAYDAREIYTGIDSTGKFRLEFLARGWTPIIVGLLVHKFVGGWPINANRVLGRSGLPISI